MSFRGHCAHQASIKTRGFQKFLPTGMYLSELHQGIIPPKIRPFPKFRVLLFLKKTSRFQNFSGTNLTQETRCFQNFSGKDYFGKLQVF